MSIPNSQLVTWSHQGSVDASSKTYASIKNALTADTSPIKDIVSSNKVRVFLQGSYANDTNTRGDSDVDVVVQYIPTFHSNKHQLPTEQRIIHDNTYEDATYTYTHLRQDVAKALQNYYGATNVDTTGKKSIKIPKNSGRLHADVVPAITYRDYAYFFGAQDSEHSKDLGICLYRSDTGEAVVNFPDQHLENGVEKHQNTNFNFKPQVRIFKNARSYAVDKGLLGKDFAPSYFLQSLIYNVPNNLFTGTEEQVAYNILRYLNENDVRHFTMQNHKHLLIGDTKEQWNFYDADTTIKALSNLWDNWYSI